MKKKKPQNNGGNLITNYTHVKKPQKNHPPSQPNSENKKSKIKTNPQKQQNNNFHESSKQMQAQPQKSQTEIIQSQHINQMQQQVKQYEESCLQMIMIGPLDTDYYYGFRKKVQGILHKYNKSQVMKLILQNSKFSGITNLKNLDNIDDDKFWSETVVAMLKNVIDQKKQKLISSCIQMLLPRSNIVICLTKAQVYMILLSMFFSIFPKQSHNPKQNPPNFSHLMTVTQKDTQSTRRVKSQKLKCIINYFKQCTKRKFKDLEKGEIQIQRTLGNVNRNQYQQVQFNMSNVDILVGKIQDRYRYDVMIDFANKRIGGGVLNRGAVQEEILFVIFPQLIATICIVYEINHNQAIIVYNAERFSLYEGYSDNFTYVGKFQQQPSQIGPFQSIIVAVDATDFKYEQVSQMMQYEQFYIQKQLVKFLIGIQGSEYHADQSMSISTGKWGCGAFGGNYHLKFIIQWIACSILSKNMKFMCQNQSEVLELKCMVNFLKRFNTVQLLQAIKQYHQFFQLGKMTQITFLQFLKKYIC